MWRALSAPKAHRILAHRDAPGLKEPQHARPERARGALPPCQGGTLFDSSFPARCAGLIPFGAFSAEDKLGHYPADKVLPHRNFDHPLAGEWSDYRDCDI